MRHTSEIARRRGVLYGAALGALLALLGAPAAGAQTVTVSRSIGFAPEASVRQQIVDECRLQTVVPSALADSSGKVELVDGKGDLELVISDVHGPGGGVFSGPKWVEVKGKLRRGGEVLTFRAKRVSVADPFAGGTCGILAKCGRNIGKDIAAWLEAPVSGAEIGDAQ
jgi:hypothetical protein